MDISLHRAGPKDYVPEIAALIWSEDPALLTLEFGTLATWEAVLAAEWPLKGAANSHDGTTLALSEGKPCGVINAFPTAEMDTRFERSDATRVSSLLTNDVAKAIDALFPPPPEDAFYILDISVASTAQNLGIGRKLVDHAAVRAKEEGADLLSLHVSIGNPALKFYQRIGFESVCCSDVPSLHRFGVSDHILMTRAIDQ